MKKNNKEITIALAGNPNCGKTSLFNELVGANQKVGNWSGVTIEKYEGKLEYKGYTIKVVDLPGTYSLTAYSPEEVAARNYLIEEKPDVVIDVIDGTNIERNLYLTVQLMELEVDMIVAMNMYDEIEAQKIQVDVKQLQTLLGNHVIPTSAVKGTGFDSLLDHVVRVYNKKITIKKNKLFFSERIEPYVEKMSKVLESQPELKARYDLRWLSIKLLENDAIVYKLVKEYPVFIKLELIIQEAITHCDSEHNSDPELVITEDRHAFINGALQETVRIPRKEKKTPTEIIDAVVINRFLGVPIFVLIMWLVFQFTFTLSELPKQWIELFFTFAGDQTALFLPDGLLQSIIVDGIIAGVGGVLVFLPHILFLFVAISFLEAIGYMARAAFVVDKIMHLVGLHGKSFLPMITGFGCSVPAFMATRTLKNENDRLVTMMIIPFMSCGAKLPVHTLLIGSFFAPHLAPFVLLLVYFFGIFVAIISAKILKSTVYKGPSEPFVMELPPYRLPKFKSIVLQTRFKAEMYLRKAGTVILAASIIIWIVCNFPQSNKIKKEYEVIKEQVMANNSLKQGEKDDKLWEIEGSMKKAQLEYSLAGRFGKLIEPVIKPLGFDWKTGIALTAGLAAKEIVVSTLATIYSLGEDDSDEASFKLAKALQKDKNFSVATALSLLVFVLLYVPCIAACGVFYKEARSIKRVIYFIIYSTGVAWICSFVVFNIVRLLI